MAARVGIAWGNLGRESDPAAWVVMRASDRAILGAASSQGGALRIAHAMWDDLDASMRLAGPTIVLVDRTSGEVRGCVARRARADDAAAQLANRTGTVVLRLPPRLLARIHRARGEEALETYIVDALSRALTR
jgi:hypothetical protein